MAGRSMLSGEGRRPDEPKKEKSLYERVKGYLGSGLLGGAAKALSEEERKKKEKKYGL